MVDLHSTQVRLMLGVYGLYIIAHDYIMASFSDIGIWRMDFRFTLRFEGEQLMTRALNDRFRSVGSDCFESRFPTVLKRKSDCEVCEVLKDAVAGCKHPSDEIIDVEQALKQHYFREKILIQSGKLLRHSAEAKNKPQKMSKFISGHQRSISPSEIFSKSTSIRFNYLKLQSRASISTSGNPRSISK